MDGHFERGAFVPESSLDDLANAALTAMYAYFLKYNELHPPGFGTVWLQSDTGFLIACTPDKKYADRLKRVIGGLK
jgi:hypothetical protein